MTERLQKFLAEAGLGSRRYCEELIRAGRVTVDGTTAELGASVDPESVEVLVDGRTVTRETKEYWLLNKPAGILSAALDTRGRPTVVECVPAGARIFPVGRLDLNSTGLLVLTNDGELAAQPAPPPLPRGEGVSGHRARDRGQIEPATIAPRCRSRGWQDVARDGGAHIE